MKLSIFCSPARKEILPVLSPLFDDLFIESYAFFFSDEWNQEVLSRLDSGLEYSDCYLIIGEEQDFHSPWFSYILGYSRRNETQIILYLREEADYAAQGDLRDLFFHAVSLETLREKLRLIMPLWDQASRGSIARKTLRDRMDDHAFEGLARAVEKGDRFMVGVYLDAGFNISRESLDHVTLLGLASRKGYTPLVRILHEAGADINQISSDRNNTPLMDAASDGHVEIVRFFIDNGADLEIKSRSGQTALVLAVGNKQEDCALHLLQAGADADVKDSLGLSARKYAALYGMTELIGLMPPEKTEE